MAPIFSRRVSVTAALLTCVGIAVVGFGSYGEQVRAMPPMLILPMILLLVTVLGSIASRNAEDVNRGTAVVDPLTGLLNRVALQTRATELQLHAAASPDRVGLIVVDIDHFKQVNDVHGHAAGDAVLVEVAARLRHELGTAGAVFRFGGEEFVVLLQSTNVSTAAGWAERLRYAIRKAPIDGIDVTASFGVAVTREGQGFEYRDLFVEADAGLYLAKSRGRDRVCAAADVESGAAPAGRPEVLGAVRRTTDVRPAAPDPAGNPADEAWSVRLGGRDEGNWLVADAIERAHVVDLLERSAKDSDINGMISFLGLALCGFWLEWWLLIPSVVTGLFWKVCTTRIPKVRRPEFAALAGLLMIVLAGALGGILADPMVLFGLPFGALVIFGACAGFNQFGAFVIGLTAMVATLLAGFLIDAQAVIDTPFIVAFPLALIAANALLGEATGRSAREHRVAAITDALTGSLNRAALDARIPQLAQQAPTSGAPITLMVVDIDHFKAVNDVHGHDVGDAVLSEVSYRIRSSLRAFDSMYRIGGEEFVVIVTDTTAADAAVIAERARRTVEKQQASGVAVTVSIGVSTASSTDPFNYDEVFAQADERLYRAKLTGRNRVVDAEPVPGELTLLAA
jgi:diguanylate cyclase (GGDEF)-like protein